MRVLHAQSQQDLTLLDLEDTGNSKEEHPKKNRIGKKSCSPDRGMFDTAAVAGDRSKNEVEKMFEKFGIKVPVGSDDEDKVQESSAEVITKDPDSIVSPSHLYNEQSKLLDDLSDVRESKDFVFSSDAALFDKSEVVRRSTSKQNNSAVKKEPKTKSQGGGVKKEKSKTGQGKGVKEKMTKKKKASVDSVDSISKPRKSSSGDKVSLDYCGASREDLEMVPGEITFTRPNHVEAVSPIRFAEIGESSTDNLKENQEDGADTFVFSPSDLTSGARFNDVFDYSEVKDDAAAVVTSQPKKFELDLDAPFATSAELVRNFLNIFSKKFVLDWFIEVNQPCLVYFASGSIALVARKVTSNCN